MDKNVEILQVSSLEDYEWPEYDPHSIPQRTRLMQDSDLSLIKSCLHSAEINMEAFIKNAKRDKLTLDEIILAIISHRKFQMNPVNEVKSEIKWKESVISAMNKDEPIDIVYPQFCVIPNAPKRYTNTGCTAGEDCTIEFFKLINRHVKEVYKPGLRFHALVDASLYASAFQTPQPEVDAYYLSLNERISALDASNCVFLYDYSNLISTKCLQEYQLQYYKFGHMAWTSDVEQLIPNTDAETLRRSVRCSVNTRRFQLSHDDHLCLFGPIKFRKTSHPFYDQIEKMTDYAFREAITIRLACNAIDISTRLWPNAIRATCHKGPKNGHWAVGLRTYPEYYGSCKLLPYHGMPIISKDSKGKAKLEIVPEVLLRCRDDLIRVTIGNSDEVYTYITSDIDNEILGDFEYSKHKGMRVSEFKNGE